MHLLLALTACSEPAGPATAFPPAGPISPADGQTAVDPGLALRLHTSFDYPDGHPLPEVIRVERVDRAGIVRGVLTRGDGYVDFTPDTPWEADATYVWSVRQPLPDTRAPEIEIDPAVIGVATFHTDDALDVLGAGIREGEQVCVVTSRPLGDEDLDGLRATLDDEPVEVVPTELLEGTGLGQGALRERDAGLGGACFEIPGVTPGAALRIWSDDQPWLIELEETPPEVIAQSRRVPR